MELKERFEQFTSPGYYSRVDSDHILELYIGLDDTGNKSIELRSLFRPRSVKGTSAIDVSQYENQKYKTIRFSLTDEEISGLFYTFCDDLIEQTRSLKDESEGYNAIVLRFHQWKKMFVSSKKDFLNESQIMGLIGELLFLKDHLSKRIGLSEALRSWSGQELTHKDFSYDDTWTEVKTIKRSSQTVKISSLEQLDSKDEGELAVYALEKMSPEYRGITLNKLIVDIRNMFDDSDDRDSFMAKVALQGYEYHNYYDDFVFEKTYFKSFRVTEGFPRLVPAAMPDGILKASYDIDLNKLNEFENR